MATPLGHMLAGAIVGVALAPPGAVRSGIVIGAALGAAADLDFIPGLLAGSPARFHHAATHSFAFAVLAGIAASLLSRERWRILPLATLAYASHLVLDVLTLDTSPPHGIPLLWPADLATFGGVDVPLPPVLHSNGETLGWHNVRVALTELLLILPLVASAYLRFRRGAPAADVASRDVVAR